MRWTKTWFTHEQLLAGGELNFEMGDKPSNWGDKETDWPVSAIDDQLIVPAPFVAKGERVFQDEQMIELGALDKDAAIYYTLDGSAPTEKSARYKKPFKIDQSVDVQRYVEDCPVCCRPSEISVAIDGAGDRVVGTARDGDA